MQKLKELRIERGIQQKDLAAVLGIGANTLSQYENGKREPDNETLVRLADYFGVSVDYLLDHATEAESSSHNIVNMERLIELRKQQNLTQQDMARILGISRQAYSNYELGNREADYTTLKKLSNYFNVTVDYLLGETDIPEKSHPTTDDDVKVALFGGDGEVTDEMWNEVQNFVDYVKSKHTKGDK